jgi:hypothetical protein
VFDSNGDAADILSEAWKVASNKGMAVENGQHSHGTREPVTVDL